MKRLIAMVLAAMLSISGTLTAFAEDANNNQPTQMGIRPPEMPEGGFPGDSGGTPPEMPEGGMLGDMPPDGEHGGFGGNTPPGSRSASFEYSAANDVTVAAELNDIAN